MASDDESPVSLGPQDVEIITRERLYKGFFSISRYCFRHRLYAGTMSEIVQREVIERRAAVVVLPYDPCRDQVVLIEQLRIPAFDNSSTPWLIEAIAGLIEPGENIEQVARREAQEEAGIVLGQLTQALTFLSSPGGTNERLTLLIGEVDASTASGHHGLACEAEDILVRVVSRQQADYWVENGVIDNAGTIIALQWLALNRAKLLVEWENK